MEDKSPDNINIEFISAIDECLKVTEEVKALLNKVLENVKNHSNRCKIAKTGGTVSSVFGSALIIGSIIAAPFTGGSSVIFVAGCGASLSAAGAVTNIGTDIADYFWSKGYQNEITTILERRKKASDELNKHFEKIQNIANDFLNDDELGLNEEESLQVAFLIHKQVRKLPNHAYNTYKNYEKVKKIYQSGKIFTLTGLRNGGNIWKGMRINSITGASYLSKLGISVSKKTAMNIVKGGTVVVNAVFIIFDVKSLIEEWKNNHPTETAVQEAIKNLTEEEENLKGLKKTLSDD